MRWSRGRGEKTRDSYHHGNLREALIEAALDLIATKGPTGFTFAEAARQAGVSAAAPYRHFRDREALLADIAERGFDLFEAELQNGWNDGKPDTFKAFENIGRAYLAFARKHPTYYTTMFDAGLSLSEYPGLVQAGDRAFNVLRHACEVVCAELPEQHRPPPLMMSLHIWSLAHGVASLFGRPDDGRRALPVPPEDLLEAGILVYLRGAGHGADPASPGGAGSSDSTP